MTWVLFMAACAAVALGASYYRDDRVRKRRLRAAHPWPIAELPEDTLGRVIGRAKLLEETLTAPLTGRECVYYNVRVSEGEQPGTTVIDDHRGVPFVLEDSTGRAIVDPTGAETVVVCDSTTTSGVLNPPDERLSTYLATFGQRPTGFMFNRALRYEESIIEIGELVSVLGAGIREPDPEAPPTSAYRGGQPTRLRLTSSARYPLLISDDPSTTSPS